MGPARAARHRPYNACPLFHTGQHPLRRLACPCRVAGDSQSRPTRPAHGYPREQALAWAAPPNLATTADSDRRRLWGRRSAQGRGRVVESARSTPAARPLPFPQEPTPGARSEREPASEAGGRGGVGPGLLRRPPSSESRRRPLLVPPRSHDPYPFLQRRTSPLVSAGPRPTTPPGTVVPPGSLVVVGGLVGCRGVAGQARLELVQLIQHCLEVADAGSDQPAHVSDRLAQRLLVLDQGVGVDDLRRWCDRRAAAVARAPG